jgi:molecular chaperone DnaK
MGGVFTKLIESNTTIPTKKSQMFSTAVDNQPAVDIHVLQGERPMASDNRTLGRFQLTDIPPSMRGIPQIEVTFDIDSNGILSVTALDKGTGKKQNVRIESGSKLSEEEIERLKNEARENEEEDKKRLRKSQIINDAENACMQSEKALDDFGDKVSDDEKSKINDKISEIRKLKDAENIDMLEKEIDEWMKLMNAISASIYSTPNSESESTSTTGTQEGQENFEDVEFEEVGSKSK